MVDYKRMEWQNRANRIAGYLAIACVIATCDEVVLAMRYHFPAWDDIAMAVTVPLGLLCRFVRNHTEMYRIDL